MRMAYEVYITPFCQRMMDKASKKNPVLRKVLERKIAEIAEDPNRYKPLRYDLAGERSVHILKSFILRFSVAGNIITLISFEHHDDAYRR
jgi:mRNA-degrading endonuclease RelE of RelBE toxin-antitoxin system